MATLGFFHNVYDNLKATEFVVQSVSHAGVQNKNKIHSHLLALAEDFSGVKPQVDYYCFGGGSVLNVQVYINHFWRVYNFFEAQLEKMRAIYPEICWVDCFLTYFFLLSGESVDLLPKLYTVAFWPDVIRDFDLAKATGFQIVHGFKNYYH